MNVIECAEMQISISASKALNTFSPSNVLAASMSCYICVTPCLSVQDIFSPKRHSFPNPVFFFKLGSTLQKGRFKTRFFLLFIAT